jgi:hypothetical protein
MELHALLEFQNGTTRRIAFSVSHAIALPHQKNRYVTHQATGTIGQVPLVADSAAHLALAGSPVSATIGSNFRWGAF